MQGKIVSSFKSHSQFNDRIYEPEKLRGFVSLNSKINYSSSGESSDQPYQENLKENFINIIEKQTKTDRKKKND